MKIKNIISVRRITFLITLFSGVYLSSNCNPDLTLNIGDSNSTYVVSGTISGLDSGNSIILQNNGGDDLTVTGTGSQIPFAFETELSQGETYYITILAQPLGQTCVVGAGLGTITSTDISNILVTCDSTAPFIIGGTVNGLIGSGLVIQNNGGDNLGLNADGGFSFPTPLNTNDTYSVTVFTQPSSPNQICSVSNASGTVASADISDVLVSCVITTYSISGTITGLNNGDQITLSNNGTEFINITSAGGTDNFFFPTPLIDGATYNVYLDSSVPTTIGCTNATGTVSGANISIALTCDYLYTVGGTITGLPSGKSIKLQNNLANTLIANSTGSNIPFTFSTPIMNGLTYNVTVLEKPLTLDCPVSLGSGNISGMNVTNVSVDCVTPPPVCGDSVCNGTENNSTCPSDCPVTVLCGDNACNGSETNATCPADCPAVDGCGDGICGSTETPITCNVDCNFIVKPVVAGNIHDTAGISDFLPGYNLEFLTTGRNEWMSFNADGTSQYMIFWDDSFSGSGTYSADVWVSALDSVGFAYANMIDSGYNLPRIITPAAGLVYLQANSNWIAGILGINVLPYKTITVDNTYYSYNLSVLQGSIIIAFSAVSGTHYTVFWDDSVGGSGTYTSNVWVSAFASPPNPNVVPIFDRIDNGYTIGKGFTASASGTVYLEVNAQWCPGTVGIKVSSP
jgi:hypothetical protein